MIIRKKKCRFHAYIPFLYCTCTNHYDDDDIIIIGKKKRRLLVAVMRYIYYIHARYSAYIIHEVQCIRI